MSLNDLNLRQCPFCGSAVRFDNADYQPQIECPRCDYIHDETPEQKAARWNSRPEVGALRMIIADLVGSASPAQSWLLGELAAEEDYGNCGKGSFGEHLSGLTHRLKFDLDSARRALEDTNPFKAGGKEKYEKLLAGYHLDAECGACGGPLDESRDAICEKCTLEMDVERLRDCVGELECRGIEIEELAEGMMFYAKGHHPPGLFQQAYLRYVGDGYQVKDIPIEKIEHVYARKVPDSSGEYSWLFHECDGPGPGAFPATVIRRWRR